MAFLNNSLRKTISQFILLNFVVFYFGSSHLDLRAETPPDQPPQSEVKTQFTNPYFKPGDAVEISVFPDTSSFLNNVFPIDGEGYIFLPVVGRTQVVAMSETEFINFLSKNFTPYLRTPSIQVRPLIRASLLGGFARPDLYYIDPNHTLWDLVQMAGGTLREDGLKKMKWERNQKEIESNLIAYYQAGKSLTDMGFRSGDQLWTKSPTITSGWDRFFSYALPIVSIGITVWSVYMTTYIVSRY
jgi:hypothetical protein